MSFTGFSNVVEFTDFAEVGEAGIVEVKVAVDFDGAKCAWGGKSSKVDLTGTVPGGLTVESICVKRAPILANRVDDEVRDPPLVELKFGLDGGGKRLWLASCSNSPCSSHSSGNTGYITVSKIKAWLTSCL